MRRFLILVLPLVVSLGLTTAAAQAVVVDMNALGSTSVAFNSSDQSGYYGVAMVPGTDGTLATNNIPTVTSSAACADPAITPDLSVSSAGLCWHSVSGASVLHGNETFDFTWEVGTQWPLTTGYVEKFLSDVAAGSGTLSSPFAVTPQYTDGTGRAANRSVYGGGCVDQGMSGNADCQFAGGPYAGHDYPTSGNCTPSGTSFEGVATSNTVCLTDAQLQSEIGSLVTETGILGRTQPGYTPVVVLLTPPGVETCLDGGGKLCSANSAAAAQFCSYHGQVSVSGTEVAYVVQPWTAMTKCDEPDVPAIPANAASDVLQTNVGMRLVSPLSQAMTATLVNPGLDGWFGLNGLEINDINGCVPLGSGLDQVTVGTSQYWIQREFNNAALMKNDPSTYFGCAPNVILAPNFVPPNPVFQGDEVAFNGSSTASTLLVPDANYHWDFGDGATATGHSVVHQYSSAGTYTVKLSVTDRGGNQATFAQQITVLTPSGQQAPPPPPPTPSSSTSGPFAVKLQLMPQGLHAVLHHGLALQVNSDEAADGLATIYISRRAARRIHLKVGKQSWVAVARGTISELKSGTGMLHLHLSRRIARKLRRLHHVTLSVRLALTGADGHHVVVDVAGSY